MKGSNAATQLRPRLKLALRTIGAHQEMTARELSLDLNVREAEAIQVVRDLERLGLTAMRHRSDHITVSYATERGQATIEQMNRERRARTDHEAALAAAHPSTIVTCPDCGGERVYCTTCTGSRMVVA